MILALQAWPVNASFQVKSGQYYMSFCEVSIYSGIIGLYCVFRSTCCAFCTLEKFGQLPFRSLGFPIRITNKKDDNTIDFSFMNPILSFEHRCHVLYLFTKRSIKLVAHSYSCLWYKKSPRYVLIRSHAVKPVHETLRLEY